MLRNNSITRRTEYNKKVDVWSLGVCGYEMISFDLPFTDELDVRDVNVSYKHLPINNHPSLVPLVHQMLIRDVASRPNVSQMQNLSIEMTEWLIAMIYNVEEVELGWDGDVSINMELITQGYDGRGRCRKVKCWRDTGRRYEQHLETWADKMGWKVIKWGDGIDISRK